MPTGTPVDKMYRHLLASGYDEESAARIAQAKTGLALRTGRPPQRGLHGKIKIGKSRKR